MAASELYSLLGDNQSTGSKIWTSAIDKFRKPTRAELWKFNRDNPMPLEMVKEFELRERNYREYA